MEAQLREHPLWRLRSKRGDYNCMGMVFANRRTCIEPDQFELIARDDGYVRLARNEDACPGDVGVYRAVQGGSVEHVSLILEVVPVVAQATVKLVMLSEFGACGEYIHDSSDWPAGMLVGTGGLKLEVWSEREA